MYLVKLLICLLSLLSLFNSNAEGQTNKPLQAFYTRLEHDDQGFTGKYADIVIRIGNKGDFIFSRTHSYLPYWLPANGAKHLVPVVIERKGDGSSERPDRNNICSNAAIVERTDKYVKIHWRYAPDITGESFTQFLEAYNRAGDPSPFYAEYADEYFTIFADGTVKREVQKGVYELEVWNNPANTVLQKFVLKSNGIEIINLPPHVAVKTGTGSEFLKKQHPVTDASLYFAFDDGEIPKEKFTTELISGKKLPVAGVNAYSKAGVSRTALSFDSYSNAVTLPPQSVPKMQDQFSIEAWVAPQEYPFNEAAIVDHINEKKGYFLGLNAKGELVVKLGDGDSIHHYTLQKIPLYEWSHIVVSLNKNKKCTLYVNGSISWNQQVLFPFADAGNQSFTIGRNAFQQQYPAGAERAVTKNFNTNFVFSGLIDEVRLYNRALQHAEIEKAYTALKLADNKPLQRWVLPAGKDQHAAFGAYYTKLNYSPEWDGLWRVGNYADIVVGFAHQPWRYVFWRGTRYLPSLVTDYGRQGIWSNDQSPEIYSGQCFEHMSDMLCRFSNIRLISSTPARVVVHWRNASASIDYKWPKLNEHGWGIWTDEYWTIYPDGVSVRHQVLHNGSDARIIEMNQNEILHHPGQTTEELIRDSAVTVGNMDGKFVTYVRSMDTTDKKVKTKNNIQYVHLQGNTSQFQIGEPGMTIDVDIFQDVWWNGWNHYPTQLIPSDGTQIFQYDRPASSCPTTFREVRHAIDSVHLEAYTIYGLTNNKPESLSQLNHSWNNAPPIINEKGVKYIQYSKAEKAYLLIKNDAVQSDVNSTNIQFTVNASSDAPVVNPAFIIKNIGEVDVKKLQIKLNGTVLKSNNNAVGIELDENGKNVLVVWLKWEGIEKFDISIG